MKRLLCPGGLAINQGIATMSECLPMQVVTGSSLGEVAQSVITHVRFPLLHPDKLSEVEKENKKNNHIPVSGRTHEYQLVGWDQGTSETRDTAIQLMLQP